MRAADFLNGTDDKSASSFLSSKGVSASAFLEEGPGDIEYAEDSYTSDPNLPRPLTEKQSEQDYWAGYYGAGEVVHPGFIGTLLDPSELALNILTGGVVGARNYGVTALRPIGREMAAWGTYGGTELYKGLKSGVSNFMRGLSAPQLEKTIPVEKAAPIIQDATGLAVRHGFPGTRAALDPTSIFKKTKKKSQPKTWVGWLKSKGGVSSLKEGGEADFLTKKESGLVGLVKKNIDAPDFDELMVYAKKDQLIPDDLGLEEFKGILKDDIFKMGAKGSRLLGKGKKLKTSFPKEELPTKGIGYPEDWDITFEPKYVQFRGGGPTYSELIENTKKAIDQYVNLVDDPAAMTNAWDAVEGWYGKSNYAGVAARRMQETIKKMLPNVERRMQLSHAIEQPEKFANALTEPEKMTMNVVKHHFDELATMGQQQGLLDNMLENYVSHIYKGSPDKIEEMVKYARSKYVPSAGSLKTKAFFNFHRKIETLAIAKQLGLKPVEDIADIVALYDNAFFKTLANKKLVDALKIMKNEKGTNLIVGYKKYINNPQLFEGYKRVDIPALNRFMYVGETPEGGMKLIKMPVMVDPRLASSLENIFGRGRIQGMLGKSIWGYKKARGVIKRIIMYNAAVHGTNIFSDVMAEVSVIPNPIKAAKVIHKGHKLWKEYSEVVDDFVKAGGNLEGLYQFNKDLRDGVLGAVGEASKNPIMKAYNWATNLNDKILWDYLVKGAQLGTFQLRRDALIKKYGKKFTKEQIDKMAAQKVNNLLGTLPHIWMDKYFREATSMAFFARNWTISNINLVANSLRTGIGLKGMTPEMKTVLQKEYVEHLAKGIFGLAAYANLMNYVMVGHSTFENEKGHKLDIDTGRRTADGKKIYISPHFYRYIHDYFSWAKDPLKTLYNKAEPILKNSLEAIANYSVWQSKKIRPEGATTGEKWLGHQVPYILRGITPAGRFFAPRGFTKDWRDIVWELTGTWERYGTSLKSSSWTSLPKQKRVEFINELNDEELRSLRIGVDIGFITNETEKGVEVATKLKEYLKRHNYEVSEFDKGIKEDLENEKYDTAIKKMREYQRYQSIKAAKDKVMPYKKYKEYLEDAR